MERAIKPNPIFGTVSRFISWEEQHWRRQKRLQEKRGDNPIKIRTTFPKPKKVTESKFVKFLNRLENRGPQKPGSLHEKWTREIRSQMTSAGTWPQGDADWDVEILAQYLQYLQRQFWNSLYPLLKQKLLPLHCGSCGWSFIKPSKKLLQKHRVPVDEREGIIDATINSLRTYNKIYEMIYRKGSRSKLFVMTHGGSFNVRFVRIYIDKYPVNDTASWYIWHDERYGLECNQKGKVEPFLVMPHMYTRIDVYNQKPEKEIREELEYPQDKRDILVF